MILRYDAVGLPGHLAWLMKKGIVILTKGRLQVEATIRLDESHYHISSKRIP
jgi:hypothetical protein